MKTFEQIELQREQNKRGAIISMTLYKELSAKIIEIITRKEGKSVTLPELIEAVHRNNPSGAMPWHILQVKIDLHERGILEVYFDRYRRQVIEINERTKRTMKRLVRSGEKQWLYLRELIRQQ